MRWFTLLLVFLSACSWQARVKYLSDEEFNCYYALKPFMNEDTQKSYLTYKTEAERTAYLKSINMQRVPPITLYDLFYQYDPQIRQAIVDGAVQVGWNKDQVLMSWGPPYDKKKVAGRAAPRSEMLLYKFEKHEDGAILVYTPDSKTEYKAVERFRREVILDSDVVAEIVEKKGWGN
ncbi:MAG: hypothetical protein FJ090_19640 [Deltaproteobacteria bacterium]|nr:hypothetical protein [Deltaproteobacteria bacterium]